MYLVPRKVEERSQTNFLTIPYEPKFTRGLESIFRKVGFKIAFISNGKILQKLLGKPKCSSIFIVISLNRGKTLTFRMFVNLHFCISLYWTVSLSYLPPFVSMHVLEKSVNFGEIKTSVVQAMFPSI